MSLTEGVRSDGGVAPFSTRSVQSEPSTLTARQQIAKVSGISQLDRSPNQCRNSG